MRNYIIITDVASDIPLELAKKYEIEVVGMRVLLDNTEFLHTVDYQNMSNSDFYKKLASGSKSLTTQITPESYINFFTEFLEQKVDILYISLSSALSATYQSVNIAKMVLLEKYKKSKIEVIDSLHASIGEGYLAMLASINKMKKYSIEDNVEFLNKIKFNIRSIFTVDDLMFLSRGGRLSKSSALIGSAMKIKPLLRINSEGELISFAKIRTRKSAIKRMVELLEKNIENFHNQSIFIIHSESLKEAESLKEQLLIKYNYINISICKLGPVVGSHTGPGVIGLVFLGKSTSESL